MPKVPRVPRVPRVPEALKTLVHLILISYIINYNSLHLGCLLTNSGLWETGYSYPLTKNQMTY